MEEYREYNKGIWIPNEIWERDDMSWLEKLIFGQIDKMSSKGKGGSCFASNKWFAEKFKVTETSISLAISHLKNLGIIEQVGFDGRKRYLRSVLSKVYEDS